MISRSHRTFFSLCYHTLYVVKYDHTAPLTLWLRIRLCANKAFPDLRGKFKVEVFGSFANGLSTWHSDVDLVVTGLFEPDRTTGCYDTKVGRDVTTPR